MVCKGKLCDDNLELNIRECANKAQKHHAAKMWSASLSYYGALLELTSRSTGAISLHVAEILDVVQVCYSRQEKYDHAIHCLR